MQNKCHRLTCRASLKVSRRCQITTAAACHLFCLHLPLFLFFGLHKFRRLRPFNLPAISNWNSGRQGGTLSAKQFALRTYKHEHCVQTKLERRGWPILKQGEGVIQLCYTWLASGQWPKQRGVTSTCCWTLFPTWTFCLHLES